ncbi:RNA 2',3'-cyclic phosphodiesterase [Caldanaerobius polysaccharolyticus]|uniref:RNA 2',3'-cyclic phosphodiesterase n=1 Tax=Caldanaerobius polysaccharolyticus TaxID=44256 RepID=UPI00047CAA3D|nr:RNA 2',3'-cyclic phosphodiesterase [Caldanaerobius polysaccharolyticus]
MRTFLAVHLSEEAVQDLCRMQEFIKAHNIKARFTPKDNFHITLKFLGEINYTDVQKIHDALKGKFTGIHPFNIKLHKVGYFPGDENIRVLWVGVVDKTRGLGRLHSIIESELACVGIPRDKRPFKSHITVAREVDKSSEIMDIIRSFCFLSGEFAVDRVTLMESRVDDYKRIYTPLFEINL